MASQELHIPLKEKLKSFPEMLGIRVSEEPSYKVLKKDGAIEIRQYCPQLRASFSMKDKSFDHFREESFKKLASYIFGGNEKKENISMTSPVLHQYEQGMWKMSFILPDKYKMATVPKPEDSEIKLEEVPEYTTATIRFSGNNDQDKIMKNEKELREWLKLHPQTKADTCGVVAQYDGPFTLPFMKVNEIQIAVKGIQ